MKTNTAKTAIASLKKTQQSPDPVPQRVLEIAERGLSEVVLEGGFIMASADKLYRHPFGRDAAISAGKLLRYDSEIARQSILLMVAKQGVKHDARTEEEPGKIFHEMKFPSSDPEQQVIFDQLRARLGIGSEQEFISYTSIDATLEFVQLVALYVKLYGAGLLATSVYRHGEIVTVGQGLRDALGWIRGTIARSDIGLIGAHRTNPHGVIVPDLLDGATSFMHADGKTLVNYTREVNTLNFQSLGYQALVEAAEILTETKEELLDEAEALRQRTIKHFWLPELQLVAMAIDRDEAGQPRPLRVKSILPAVALGTGIFDANPEIIQAALESLYTPDMMTCVGPRTQTLSVDVGYTRYQEPPWPVLIGRAIEGAVRCHEDTIAIDLIERLLAGAYATGRAEEFHQVTKDNELGIFVADKAPGVTAVVATNKPEAPQAWTAATLYQLITETLPLLKERRATAPPSRLAVDLSLNRDLKTAGYTLNQKKAQKLEAAILKTYTAAVYHGGW